MRAITSRRVGIRLRVVAAAVALLSAGCALTRSQVKTLRDAEAARIAFDEPVATTITALNELPSHCGPAGNRRRPPEEFRVYEVVGTITRVKREPDRDIHIVLADLVQPRDRIVIELGDPDTSDGRRSAHRDRLVAAQRMFDALQKALRTSHPSELVGRRVRVAGVGFYDLNHFQRGRTRSCIELHPVLSIEDAGQTAGYPVPPTAGSCASACQRNPTPCHVLTESSYIQMHARVDVSADGAHDSHDAGESVQQRYPSWRGDLLVPDVRWTVFRTETGEPYGDGPRRGAVDATPSRINTSVQLDAVTAGNLLPPFPYFRYPYSVEAPLPAASRPY